MKKLISSFDNNKVKVLSTTFATMLKQADQYKSKASMNLDFGSLSKTVAQLPSKTAKRRKRTISLIDPATSKASDINTLTATLLKYDTINVVSNSEVVNKAFRLQKESSQFNTAQYAKSSATKDSAAIKYFIDNFAFKVGSVELAWAANKHVCLKTQDSLNIKKVIDSHYQSKMPTLLRGGIMDMDEIKSSFAAISLRYLQMKKLKLNSKLEVPDIEGMSTLKLTLDGINKTFDNVIELEKNFAATDKAFRMRIHKQTNNYNSFINLIKYTRNITTVTNATLTEELWKDEKFVEYAPGEKYLTSEVITNIKEKMKSIKYPHWTYFNNPLVQPFL